MSCLDIILTNKPKSHMHTTSLELGISDVHKMSLTILKSQISRLKPQKISYRSYKYFNQEIFIKDLDKNLISDFFSVYKQNKTMQSNTMQNNAKQ